VYNIEQREKNTFDFNKMSKIYKRKESNGMNQYKILDGQGMRIDLMDSIMTFNAHSLIVALADSYYYYDLLKDNIL
jgi:hypothetical protein